MVELLQTTFLRAALKHVLQSLDETKIVQIESQTRQRENSSYASAVATSRCNLPASQSGIDATARVMISGVPPQIMQTTWLGTQ